MAEEMLPLIVHLPCYPEMPDRELRRLAREVRGLGAQVRNAALAVPPTAVDRFRTDERRRDFVDRNLNEIAHALHADRFAAPERLAVFGADRPAPIRRLIAHSVDKRRRLGRPAGDKLARVTFDRRSLAFPLLADVDHERRRASIDRK